MDKISLPVAQQAKIVSLSTSATGANWVTLPNEPCYTFEIVNTTGTTIEYRRNGAGDAMPILDGSSRMILAISNANEIDVRRKDVSNTQVSIQIEVFR